jgi:hypothetical protein
MTDRQAELKVTVVRDHDDECSVVATIRAGSFSGSGRAWLHIADVSEFAASVKRLAGTSKGKATLRGGYVNSDGTPNPTVNVQLRPHGVRGHIAIVAELASDPPASNAVTPFVGRTSGALVVEPSALDQFADRLMNIPKGAEVEAAVPGESAT